MKVGNSSVLSLARQPGWGCLISEGSCICYFEITINKTSVWDLVIKTGRRSAWEQQNFWHTPAYQPEFKMKVAADWQRIYSAAPALLYSYDTHLESQKKRKWTNAHTHCKSVIGINPWGKHNSLYCRVLNRVSVIQSPLEYVLGPVADWFSLF